MELGTNSDLVCFVGAIFILERARATYSKYIHVTPENIRDKHERESERYICSNIKFDPV